MKKLVTIAIAALAGQLIADTITWTGGAETLGWGNAGNWDLNRVPGETDDVVIDGNITVSRGGNNLVISSLTLRNGASVEAVNELKSEGGATSPVYTGGKVSCSLVALITGPVTISDAEIANNGTAHNAGFWHAGGYLNFVDGTEGSAKYTFQTSLSSNPYSTFFSGANPLIRYKDQVINEAMFNTHFTYTDNNDGTTTLSLKSVDGWELGVLAVGDVEDSQVEVSVTATKYSGSDATVYFVQGARDYGETFANWPTATEGETVSATGEVSDTLTLEDGYNYIRAFLLYNGEYSATAAVARRIMAPYGDYGELTDVYEYIGEGNNLGDAANWAKDKSAPAAEAPTAGADIRWFGKNAYYSGSLAITAKDYFDGATLALSGDCNVSSDVVFSNTVISIATIVVSSPVVFSLYGSDMTTTRNDQWLGVYPPGTYTGSSTKTFVNFLSGKASSFTFTDNAINISDADSAKSDLVTPGYLKLDGAAIADSDWDAFFSVEVSGKTVKITYDPVVDENMILSVAFSDVTATSATLTASIFSIADGASVIVACDTAEITEANIIAKGETVIVNEGVATKAVTSLVSDNVYSFAFAIVQDNEVKAFKSGQFVASDFDYVYMDGAWINGFASDMGKNANAPGGPDSALIIGTLSVTGQEVCPSRKKLKDAVVSANTILLSESADSATASMELCNSVYINNKTGDLAVTAPYGIYACPRPFNFTSASGNGVVRRGDAYVCYVISDQCAAVYSGLFENQKIRLEGQAVSEEMFRSSFSTNVVDTEKTIVINEETVPLKQLTVTYWEPFPASARDADWTVQPGARVKLAKNTRIGALDIPDATDVKIDLNGFKLTVSSLMIAGEKKKGEFTVATLPDILTGEGKLVVGGSGFAVFVR